MGVVVVWDRDDGAWHAVGLLGVMPVLLLMGEACGSCLLGCWCGVWESYSGREHLCMPARAVIVAGVAGFCGWLCWLWLLCCSGRLRPSGALCVGVCFVL